MLKRWGFFRKGSEQNQCGSTVQKQLLHTEKKLAGRWDAIPRKTNSIRFHSLLPHRTPLYVLPVISFLSIISFGLVML